MVVVDDEKALLKGTVRKLRAERKTLHLMLSEAGIPDDILGDGVRTCLIGRVEVLLARYEERAKPSIVRAMTKSSSQMNSAEDMQAVADSLPRVESRH